MIGSGFLEGGFIKMMKQAYTDASVIDGRSIHSFVLLQGEKVVLEKCFKSDIKSSMKAEIVSVIAFLLECGKLNLKDVVVSTDNLGVVTLNKKHKAYGGLIHWMRQLLMDTRGEIQWIRRNQNKRADNMCSVARKEIDKVDEIDFQHLIKDLNPTDIMKLPKELKLRQNRVYHCNEVQDKIGVNEISESDLTHMYQYYCSLIFKKKRVPIENILHWKKEISNSKKGRLYFIESFICKNHDVKDVDFMRASHAFE